MRRAVGQGSSDKNRGFSISIIPISTSQVASMSPKSDNYTIGYLTFETSILDAGLRLNVNYEHADQASEPINKVVLLSQASRKWGAMEEGDHLTNITPSVITEKNEIMREI